MEQQALSDFSVTKCILAETTNSSATAGGCSEQVGKNANNSADIVSAEVKQEGDSTLSGKGQYINMELAGPSCPVQ